MRRFLAALMLVAGAAGAAPALYGGKSVDYWVDHLEEPGALEACGQALRDPDERTRFVVAKGLGAVAAGSIEGARPEAAFPWLLQALHDSFAQVRYAAVIGLESAFEAGADSDLRIDGLLDALRPDLCSDPGSEACVHFDRLRKGAAPVLAEAGGMVSGRSVLDTRPEATGPDLSLAWRREHGELRALQEARHPEAGPAGGLEGRLLESVEQRGSAWILRDSEGRFGSREILLRQHGDTLYSFVLVLPQQGAATTARVPGYVIGAFPVPGGP